MSFARFMALALYHPRVGYYRQATCRIGYERGTDFFTASTSGAVFGGMVAAACVTLLRGRDPQAFTFIEIGPEAAPAATPTSDSADAAEGILGGVDHPFGARQTIRLGEPLAIHGNCVVFSNELFDAQPVHRYVFRSGRWRELGVKLEAGRLHEIEVSGGPPASARFPPQAPEGYVIDAPFAAVELADEIAGQPWSGLFVAADYGKSWRELIEATPAGTARAYHRHRQSNDLLDRPGEQDLTCHVCWDWLVEALQRQGFSASPVESQESFFVRHAGEYLSRAVAEEAPRFSRRKLSILQLIHPSHLGHKFQVLHAWRE
jgi:SAM-dependent MidA family methyltransferase